MDKLGKSVIPTISKTILKGIGILLLASLVGMLALVAVFALPTKEMTVHVKEDVEMLSRENSYPTLFSQNENRMNLQNFTDPSILLVNSRGFARDNITDAMMLLIAIYNGESSEASSAEADAEDDVAPGNAANASMSPLTRAILADHPSYPGDGGYTVGELGWYLSDSNSYYYDVENYARYWHGYLVVLKPLLLIFTYAQIRWINVVCMALLFVLLLRNLARRSDGKNLALLCYTILFTVPILLPFCMQFCTTTYVCLGAMLFVTRGKPGASSMSGDSLLTVEKFNGLTGQSMTRKIKYIPLTLEASRSAWLFFSIGIATAYFDFLTFPLMALGLPLVYLLNHSEEYDWRKKVGYVFRNGVVWACGYVGMWAMKWVIASVVLGRNMIADGISQVLYRSSSTPDLGDFTISPLTAIASNLSCFTNLYFVILIVVGVATAIILGRKRYGTRLDLPACVPYLCICIVPFVWCACFKNHSYTHGSFTYRMFTMTIYAGMSMLVGCRRTEEKL